MNKNIIELNGKRYDALTGAYLGKSTQKPVGPSVSSSSSKKSARVIDGFIRPNNPNGTATAAKPIVKPAKVITEVAAPFVPKKVTKQAVQEKSTAVKAPKAEPKVEVKAKATVAAPAKQPQKIQVHESAPAHVIGAHQPEHAKTLMGRASQKPLYSLKPAIKPQAPAELAAVPISAVTHKRSALSVDPDRMVRAQMASKHQAVTRFPKTSAHTTIGSPANNLHTQTHVPIIAVRPVPLVAHAQAAHQVPHKPHQDIFEAAIAEATSHLQPAHRIRRSTQRKLASMLAGGTALLVIGGFFAFLNMSNIQVHVASIQAGFHASVPGYAPIGYQLTGGVQRTGDAVSMKYQSGENTYTLTQQPSSWDDETLLENTLPLQSQHQIIQVGGRTVYIYDGNNAVWVTGNVRYDIVGNAPLNSADISHLAMSL